MTDPSLTYALLAACIVLVVGMAVCVYNWYNMRYKARYWLGKYEDIQDICEKLSYRLGNRKRDPQTGRWMK